MILYADLQRKRVCSSPSGEQLVFPEFLAGDTVEHSVRFLDTVDGRFVEKDLPVAALRVSVGARDARPESGSFRLKVGPAAASPSNTTAPLPWDATAAAVQAALNSVADGPGDFVADFVEGTYSVERQGGQQFSLVVAHNDLSPLSVLRIAAVEADARYYVTLRPTQLPVIFTDSTRLTLPGAPAVSTVQDGGADASAVVMWNEIQSLRVPADFRGTFQLRRGLAKTALLDPLDGPEQIKAALDNLLRFEGGSVAVTNPETGIAYIEFRGDLAGTDLEPLEVVVTSSAPPDLTWTLDLSTRRLRELMDLYEAITVPYEAEADIYREAGNPSAGTYTIKLWSQDVTIRRPLIWPELATVQEIDWLRPPNAVAYHAFDYSQVLTGSQQAVTAAMVSGTVHAVAHNLGTPAVQVIVREAHNGGRLLRPDEYSVAFPSLDEAVITLAEEPAAPLVAHLVGVGPASAFQSHTHTIRQVTMLQDTLDQLGERVSRLESLVGRPETVTVVQSGNDSATFVIPDIGEVLPDRAVMESVTTVTSQVSSDSTNKTSVVEGTDLQEQKKAEEAERVRREAEEAARKKAEDEAAKKAADELAARTSISTGSIITRLAFPEYSATYPPLRGTKLPLLLAAQRNTSPQGVSSLPLSPSANVYRNTGTSDILLPGGNGRKSQPCHAGDYFAWDGRMFYRAAKRGDIYYPAEMERTLWRAVLGSLMPRGSIACAAFDLALELKAGGPEAAQSESPRLDIGAQYMLVFEAVPITDETGSPNIGSGGTPVVLGEYRIPVSAAKMSNAFGVKLARSSSGESSSQTSGLNSTTNGPALPDNFALRCRLTCFDADDTTPDPRGTITVTMPATVLTVEKA